MRTVGWENFRGKYHSGNVDAFEWVMLKFILEKQDVKVCAVINLPSIEFKCDGVIKAPYKQEFVYRLNSCQVFR
jgi:hypothetical protein